MSDKIMLVGALAALLLAGGFAPQLFGSEKTGMANPASVYCAESGYKTDIRTSPNGSQYGSCIFSDGNECEEWAFFRGECGDEYRKPQVPQTEGFCRSDEDCACGTHVKTGKCFYGNKRYVNTEKQCPGFCSGFAVNLTSKCENNECRLVPAKAKD
jgi:putative hemolysin